jgi:hypothetical protein
VISLRKKKESEVSLVTLIEDFKELNSVRKTSAMYKKDLTVRELLSKIARKGTVGIPGILPIFKESQLTHCYRI